MKRKVIIIIILMTVLLGLSIGSYAYFMLELNKSASGTIKVSTSEELTEKNFEDTIHQYNIEALQFNTKDKVSTNRYNLKLATGIQIIMQHDLVIQFDCNLDLNGGSIDLNGYQMSVKHSFSGITTICNGTIKNSNLEATSRLSIDTPNSIVKLGDNGLDNVSLVTVSANPTLLLTAALNFALGNIVHHNLRDSLIETYDEVVVLDSAGCDFEHADSTCVGNCIYTYDDLDLIDHYYQYDITLSYNSSDEGILSSTGKMLSTGSTLLKITASYQGSSLETYANVHVIEKVEEKVNAAKFVLLQYLSRYLDSSDPKKYRFASNIMLPAKDSYLDCTYHFDVYNGNTLLGSDENLSPYLEKCGDHHVLMNATSAINSFVIRVNSNEDTAVKIATGKLDVNASDSQSTFDNTTVASNILNYYYTGKISVTESADGSYTITPNSILTLQAIKDYGIETISNLENSLVNDNDGTYKIDASTNSLQIIGSKDTNNEPNELQNVSLKVTFTFTSGTPEIVTKYVPIKYFKDSGGGSETTVSSFRPYYLYYDKYIESTTKGYTYQDFYIPFRLKNNYPLYILNPIIYKEGDSTKTPLDIPALKIYLVKILNNNTVEHINDDQYTPAYFYENGTTNKTALPAELQNTKIAWYIDINQKTIPPYNTVMELTYMYCLDNGRNFVFNEDGSGAHMISKLTIPGILRCGSGEAFEEEDLYQEIFKIYHSESYVKDVTYLVVDRVQRNLGNITIAGTIYKNGMLDLSGTSYNLKGLEYLKSLEKLNLTKSGLVNSDSFSDNAAPQIPAIDYISQMESLKYLDLSNTGISDRKVKYADGSNRALPGNNDNQFLQKLSNLTFLEELYLQGNQIYSFSALNDFKNLKKVNVGDNIFTANYKIFGDRIDLSDIFTSIVNTSYGTNGVTNISTFMALKNKGVVVDGYVESGNSVEKNIILALNNIEYQNKIGTSDDISIAYKGLSETLDDYGIPPTYTVNVKGDVAITQNECTLYFVNVSETEFKIVLTYNYTAKPTGILAGIFAESQNFPITFEVTHKVERQ